MTTSPTHAEMHIFNQTYQLLVWLLPQCERFPKSQRFVVTARLQAALLDFQECITHANVRAGRERMSHLRQADGHLDVLRLYLRLAHQMGWLSLGSYEHVSRMVAQVGKLLGGWLKQTQHHGGAERVGAGANPGPNPS